MVLIVSSFPILLLTFVYGSMDLMDLAFLMVCFLVTAVFCGGIGIFSSSLMRRSTFSNVCTYGILLLVVVGTYMLNIFLLNMSQMQIAEEIYQLGETRPAASSGSAVYLLLLNPLATFGEIMEKQVTGGIADLSIRRFLGNGPDICYPAGNRGLYQRILRTGGGIISEQTPGTKARNYFFPARNRIISGLADLVLIVEAREKSGSLITAQWALDQGKAVFAVPGPVKEERSMGCHKLIYDGAGIAYTPEILLREMGIEYENPVKIKTKNDLGLATDLKLVYSCLDLRPKSMDFLIQKTGLPPEKIGSLMLELTLSGLALEVGRHYYVKTT